ncbi:MAG: type II toxin-antitoxin system VapC family toxin [Chitinispirillales bacterium]|jgi:PIN domain nuclease of toxin-antitoxin system|nr:type II toxin-antitoxin system VapC family toxin [Chitinispirillales bacterium]
MRYLIDSNILIFCASDKGRLSKKVKAVIYDCENRIYISSRCVEELIALQQSNKIEVKQWKSAEDIIGYITNELGFEIKYIAKEHLQTLACLPLLYGHKDPTDRMIIAQAITENITMISSDTEFPRYVKYGLDLVYNPK